MSWGHWVMASGVVIVIILVDPLIVWLTHRVSSHPEIEIIHPGERPLPAYLADLWREADRVLKELGFELGPRVLVNDHVANSVLAAIMYWQPDDLDMAMACAVHRKHAGTVELVMAYVEFSADLTDGSSIAVCNSPRVAFEPRDAPCLNLRFPRERSIRRLYTLYRAGVARHARTARKPRPGGVWWETAFLETITRYTERMTRAGLMRPCGDGRHRLTVKGALLGTWINMQPLRWLLDLRLGRREREMLTLTGE